MIEIISGTWAANETKTFMINGEYLEILEAQYPCDVMLMDKSGAQLSIMRGSEASFFSRPKEGFQAVQITSAQAQSIRIFVGSGDAGTRRISSTVQVVDGNKARSLAGAGFSWRCSSTTTVAANRPHAQLWNPPGSGVRVVVDGMLLTSTSATPLTWGIANAALSTPSGNAVSNILGGSVAVPQAQPKVQESNGFLLGNILGTAFVAANGMFEAQFRRPVVLMPGYGLNVAAELAGLAIGLSGCVQFFEETL